MDSETKQALDKMQEQLKTLTDEFIKFKREYTDTIYHLNDENIDFISSSKIRN
jgi:hypothetical protein